jgi:hypothetical protein
MFQFPVMVSDTSQIKVALAVTLAALVLLRSSAGCEGSAIARPMATYRSARY